MSILTSVLDVAVSPLTTCGAAVMYAVRRAGLQRKPLTRKIFLKAGVFPLRDHYYEPLFHPRHLRQSLREDRHLPGLNLQVEAQLRLLEQMRYTDELLAFPQERTGRTEFYYDNPSFTAGDAEFLYNMIRLRKPGRIIEIGSGHSTLMAMNAVRQNQQDDLSYVCDHLCIEPYEQPWLESTGVRVLRQCVETVDRRLFDQLGPGDILFIDSSHVIRPQGDVLCEYLEILPQLRPGVLVHIHDIFTPKDYLDEWIRQQFLLWNEQYLLEAFLSFNSAFRVVAALNHLKHHHFAALAASCPILAGRPTAEPGSFWIERVERATVPHQN